MTQSAAPTAARRSSGVLSSRMFRMGLIALGVFVLVAIAAVVVVSVMTSSRNQPPGFDVYPGAQIIDKQQTVSSDRQLFTTSDSVQDVLNFYNQKLGKVDGADQCSKTYLTDPPSEDPGKYRGRCVVDNSLLSTSQVLKITVVYQSINGANMTVILVERNWGGA